MAWSSARQRLKMWTRCSRRFPDARVELFLEPGQHLGDTIQDGKSFRYGLVNLGGHGETDLHRRFEEAKALLPFEFADL